MLITFTPLAGTTDVFDVMADQQVVGIVWRANTVWHAHAHNMAAPEISAASREEAAEALLKPR